MTTKPDEPPSTSSFAVTKRPRTVRAKFPKVRTGCVTCKRRHVKCDEAKPSCMRCLKWIGHCGGYESTSTTRSSTTTPEPATSSIEAVQATSHPTPPNSDHRLSFGESDSPDLFSSHSTPALFQHPFNDTTEFSAERVECGDECTFCSHFWTNVVPQLVEEHAAVRAANQAVHTLILAKQPSLMETDATLSEQHYSQALRWYDLALREVRSTSLCFSDVRPLILCSMFFVIFETIHGDKRAAAAHMYNGQRMMDEMMLLTSPLSLQRQLGHLSKFLAQQVRQSPTDTFGDSPEWTEIACAQSWA